MPGQKPPPQAYLCGEPTSGVDLAGLTGEPLY